MAPTLLPYSDIPIIEINTVGKNKGTIKIRNPKGLESIVDFSGDTMTFSGDLPVDEAAEFFFDSLKNYFDANLASQIA